MTLVHRPFRGRPRRSDGGLRLPHPQRAATAALALLLAGCASVAPDGGERGVQALVARNPIVGDAAPRRAPDAASRQAVDALLLQPLDAQAAVRIALANGPRMQEAFAAAACSCHGASRAAPSAPPSTARRGRAAGTVVGLGMASAFAAHAARVLEEREGEKVMASCNR